MLGESYRSSRKESKRRDDVAERLESLEAEIGSIKELLEGNGAFQRSLTEMREQ